MTQVAVSQERCQFRPQLSLQERDRRWHALRARMAAAGLDCLLVWGSDLFNGCGMANFRYITQVAGHHGGFAVFPLAGEPVVLHAPPHEHLPYSSWLTAQRWVTDIRPNQGIPGLVAVLAELGLDRGHIGIVGYRSMLVAEAIPHDAYMDLQQRLPQARFSRQVAMLEDLRLVKSPAEIEMLSESCRIARKVVDRMIQVAAPGVTEAEVVAEMLATQVRSGGEPQIFTMLVSGPAAATPGAPAAYQLHGIPAPASPSQRPLARGDVVACEFHTSYNGYLAAVEFSLCIGPAPDPVRRIHAVCVACLEEALPLFRPGVSLKELWEGMRRPAERAGMDYVELGFHGHGLASPEFPTAVYKPGDPLLGGSDLGDVSLQANMVFGTNIDMFDPRWRPDLGLMFGDTVVVTPAGGRKLVDIPLYLPECG